MTKRQQILDAQCALSEAQAAEIIDKYSPGSVEGMGRYRAAWLGDRHAGSLDIFRGKEGEMCWFHFPTGRGGSVYQFLTKEMGLDPQQALEELMAAVGVAGRGSISPYKPPRGVAPVSRAKPTYPGPSRATLGLWERAKAELSNRGLPPSSAKRGYTLEGAVAAGIGRDGDDTLYPVYNAKGDLVTLKRRYHAPVRGRFRWEDKGADNPPSYSVGFAQAKRGVVIVEGEGKMWSVWMALRGLGHPGDWATVGMPGTNSNIPAEPLKRLDLPVYILPDEGEAGAKAAQSWLEQCQAAGIQAFLLNPIGDACDVAHERGLDALASILGHEILMAREGYGKGARRTGRARSAGAKRRLDVAIKAGMHPDQVSRYKAHPNVKYAAIRNALALDVDYHAVLTMALGYKQVTVHKVALLLRVTEARARQILRAMEEHGLLTRFTVPQGRGRPPSVFVLAPRWLNAVQSFSPPVSLETIHRWVEKVKTDFARLVEWCKQRGVSVGDFLQRSRVNEPLLT